MRTNGWGCLAIVLVACGHAAAPAHAPPTNTDNTAPPAPRDRSPAARILAGQTASVLVHGDDVLVDGGGPLQISHDRGKTFTPWTAGENLCVSSVVATGATIYAVAPICAATDVQTHPEHLFRSTDDGATWTDAGVHDVYLVGVDPRDPRVVYAHDGCTGSWLCRSDDAGATWKPITPPAPSPTYASLEGQAILADDGALYATPPREHGDEVDRSDDRGATWHPVISDPDAHDVFLAAVLGDGTVLGYNRDACELDRAARGGAFTRPVKPSSCSPGMFVGGHDQIACAVLGDDQIVVSRDAGASWQPVVLPEQKGLRYECAVAGDRVLVSGAEGLYSAPAPW